MTGETINHYKILGKLAEAGSPALRVAYARVQLTSGFARGRPSPCS